MLSSTGDRSAKTAEDAESMTLSQEILVLDLGDDNVGTTEKPAPRRPAAAAAAPPQDRRRFNSALSNCEYPGKGRAVRLVLVDEREVTGHREILEQLVVLSAGSVLPTDDSHRSGKVHESSNGSI